MKVLFVVSELYFSEPLGVMQLSAICKRAGHRTKLCSLKDHSLRQALTDFVPEVVAYSTMTSDEKLFARGDAAVREWSQRSGHAVWRIMGGPHPTYFPEVLTRLELDAICVGDGDYAILGILERAAAGEPLCGIPNVLTAPDDTLIKEVVHDVGALPWPDRDLLYDESPDLLDIGIRSFLTQRGCPYKCTYCFNHAFIQLFKEEFQGPGRTLMRRRPVDDLLDEIEAVVQHYPQARFLRFADDVFAIKRDAWLEEFAEKYPRRIGLPFYCLIRANALSEDVAQLLAHAGCRAVGMSIETGSHAIRNGVLKRNMPDAMVRESFATARRYGLAQFANTMLGLPGTTLADDFQSLDFVRSLDAVAPTFGIFTPFPKTELTRIAQEMGVLDADADCVHNYRARSVLTCFTDAEKEVQLRLSYLAPLFCRVPDAVYPAIHVLTRLPLTWLYSVLSAAYSTWNLSQRVFRGAYPRTPQAMVRNVVRAVRYLVFAGATDLHDDHRSAGEKESGPTMFRQGAPGTFPQAGEHGLARSLRR